MPDLQVSGREQTADWIETSLLVRGTQQLGLDRLHQLAADEIAANPAGINLALTVMARRQETLGAAYPFEVNELAVRSRTSAASMPYSALLLLSSGGPARQLLNPAPTTEMAEVFEDIVVAASAALLGPGADALRFGWPSKIGRPPEFYGAIEWLAGRMGIKPGSAYRPPRRKDGGVDVVAWRPFPDGRSGFPVMLVQCTLQGEVITKASDIDTRYWAGWLTLDNEPATALAVPQTIPAGVTWDEVAVGTLILERVRIAGLLGTGLAHEGLDDMLAGQLADLHELLGAAET